MFSFYLKDLRYFFQTNGCYYKSAKGCEIVTFDDIKLYDFTNSSVGMCPLDMQPIVNKSVTKAINKGNTTTLNSHLEYECAKLLIDTHKWSDMVRFTKSGGEAMSVAVRIARTYKKQDKILFCGYHGWHDWYISANIKIPINLTNTPPGGFFRNSKSFRWFS